MCKYSIPVGLWEKKMCPPCLILVLTSHHGRQNLFFLEVKNFFLHNAGFLGAQPRCLNSFSILQVFFSQKWLCNAPSACLGGIDFEDKLATDMTMRSSFRPSLSSSPCSSRTKFPSAKKKGSTKIFRQTKDSGQIIIFHQPGFS